MPLWPRQPRNQPEAVALSRCRVHGKTVWAEYYGTMGVKTLIVVHAEFLMNQWKERIEQFVSGAKLGKIQGKVVKTKDKNIVIGMLQTLCKKDFPEDTFKGFGLVIYDECHHLGAEVFSKALLKTNFKYLWGYRLHRSAPMGFQRCLSGIWGLWCMLSRSEVRRRRCEGDKI